MTALIVRVMGRRTPKGSFVRQLDSLTFDKEVHVVSRERTFHLALLARSIPTAGWLASMIRFGPHRSSSIPLPGASIRR